MQDTARVFPQTIRKNPVQIYGISTEYNVIPEMQENSLHLAQAKKDIDTILSDYYSRYHMIREDIRNIVYNRQLYPSLKNRENILPLRDMALHCDRQKSLIINHWLKQSSTPMVLRYSEEIVDPVFWLTDYDRFYPVTTDFEQLPTTRVRIVSDGTSSQLNCSLMLGGENGDSPILGLNGESYIWKKTPVPGKPNYYWLVSEERNMMLHYNNANELIATPFWPIDQYSWQFNEEGGTELNWLVTNSEKNDGGSTVMIFVNVYETGRTHVVADSWININPSPNLVINRVTVISNHPFYLDRACLWKVTLV